ncbi:MAG: DUF234 domain-containing protein, partial [Candidatus Omnitrophota bacterium]
RLLSDNYERISKDIFQKYVFEKKIDLKFERYGKWWDKNEEIDLVAVNRESNEILFGEVKWSNKPVGIDIYRKLKDKTENVVWGKDNRRQYFCLFSKSGFTSEMLKLAKKENVYLFHKDLYL